MEKIQMTISVSAQEAVKIAGILAGGMTEAASVQITPTNPVQHTAPPEQYTAPIQTAPVQPTPQPVTAPIAAPHEYTTEEIQAACAPLMDTGKQAELVGLLAEFGVQSLPQLAKEQFGAFATKLRGLGAKI